MPRVRVLHVITQLELGGAQRTTLELLRRLNRRRFGLALASTPGGPLEPEARAIPELDVHTVASLVRPIHPWQDLLAGRELARLMRTGRFTIVHTHSSKAGLLGRWAARRAGVPVICHTIHGFAFHPYQPAPVRWALQAAERWAARRTTRLITVSRHDQAVGLAAGIGQRAQYRYIPYGIDRQRFHRNGLTPQVARLQVGLRPNAPTIGMIACLKPQKAPEDFLAVCARVRRQIPDMQGVLVGDGMLRHAVERRRRRLGLEGAVHLLGWRREIPEILAACDVVVLTSRWEGLPIAVLEAQAMGVPVIATDTGGIRDCIPGGTQDRLVPIGDVGAMSAAVVRLLREPKAAQPQLHAHAQERFCAERMVEDVEAMYTDLLTQAGVAG